MPAIHTDPYPKLSTAGALTIWGSDFPSTDCPSISRGEVVIPSTPYIPTCPLPQLPDRAFSYSLPPGYTIVADHYGAPIPIARLDLLANLTVWFMPSLILLALYLTIQEYRSWATH
jgi:hypothetical protein